VPDKTGVNRDQVLISELWASRKKRRNGAAFKVNCPLLRPTPFNTFYLGCPPKAGVTGSSPVGRASKQKEAPLGPLFVYLVFPPKETDVVRPIAIAIGDERRSREPEGSKQPQGCFDQSCPRYQETKPVPNCCRLFLVFYRESTTRTPRR